MSPIHDCSVTLLEVKQFATGHVFLFSAPVVFLVKFTVVYRCRSSNMISDLSEIVVGVRHYESISMVPMKLMLFVEHSRDLLDISGGKFHFGRKKRNRESSRKKKCSLFWPICLEKP